MWQTNQASHVERIEGVAHEPDRSMRFGVTGRARRRIEGGRNAWDERDVPGGLLDEMLPVAVARNKQTPGFGLGRAVGKDLKRSVTFECDRNRACRLAVYAALISREQLLLKRLRHFVEARWMTLPVEVRWYFVQPGGAPGKSHVPRSENNLSVDAYAPGRPHLNCVVTDFPR